MTSAELARQGDIDAIFDRMDLKSDSRADRDVYKWLCYAEDLGHEEAEDRIGDVLEVSSLRYDDDGYEQAAAHWELGVAYLLESDGLTFDARLARKHLEEGLQRYSLELINECTNERYDADEVLAALSGERKALLEDVFTDAPYRYVRYKLDALKRLREIDSVPKVVLQSVGTDLLRSVRELVGDDVEGDERE